MATIEVDELEVQQNRQLRATIEGYKKNPKAWRKLLEAQKITNPDAKIPELDEPDPIEEIRKASDKRISDLEAKIEADKQERDRNTTLAGLQAKKDAGMTELKRRKWTDDGLKAIERIMEEKGILDPLDAAAIFERDHPPQAPIAQSGSGAWNFTDIPTDGDADLKQLIASKGENDALAEKMARDALKEIRGNPRV